MNQGQPRDLDERDPRWLRYRTGMMTDFVRELRQRIDSLVSGRDEGV